MMSQFVCGFGLPLAPIGKKNCRRGRLKLFGDRLLRLAVSESSVPNLPSPGRKTAQGLHGKFDSWPMSCGSGATLACVRDYLRASWCGFNE